jgi:hypothetical protein
MNRGRANGYVGATRAEYRKAATRAERFDSMSRTLVFVSLAVAVAMHIDDDGGGRRLGDVLLTTVLALLAFAGPWYGARQFTEAQMQKAPRLKPRL